MPKEVDRRSVLRVGALAAGAAVLGAVGGRVSALGAHSDDAEHFDVAIVGGGVSGIYAAWRLRGCDGDESGRPLRVGVFERSIHILGRVRSFRLDGTERPGELGAMRYMPHRHHLVRTLVEDKLRLSTLPFEVGGDANLLYLRAQRMTAREVEKSPERLPYRLGANEAGKTPDALGIMALQALVPDAFARDEATWEALRAKKTALVRDVRSGRTVSVPLADIGYRNALAYVLSPDALRLVTDAGGYDCATFNYNALEALRDTAAESGPEVTYRTPVDGMSAIPNALRAQYEAKGGEIFVRHRLEHVEYDAKRGQFVLRFAVSSGGVRTVRAGRVILAMPPRPLKDLVARSPLLETAGLAALLDAVRAVPMTRVLSSYNSAWWKDLGIVSGRSVSDLPLRQLYYFGASAKEAGARSFTMAYTDGTGDEYFAGYPHSDTSSASDAPRVLEPSARLLEELRAQASELHGRDVPAPEQCVVKRWSSDAYGGAYHLWNPGVRTTETAKTMLQPLHREGTPLPLYICGEAFSHSQGWVEGALETAEEVLRRFGKTPLTAGAAGGRAVAAEREPQLDCMTCHSHARVQAGTLR